MTRHLLIVDDDASVRRALTRSLRDLGFSILEASDGSEGLALAMANPPALVLTDGEMREMHGPEFITELRKVPSCKDVPVILCSGNADLAGVAAELGVPFFQKARHTTKELITLILQAVG